MRAILTLTVGALLLMVPGAGEAIQLWNASKKPRVVDLHQYLAPYMDPATLQDILNAANANFQMMP